MKDLLCPSECSDDNDPFHTFSFLIGVAFRIVFSCVNICRRRKRLRLRRTWCGDVWQSALGEGNSDVSRDRDAEFHVFQAFYDSSYAMEFLSECVNFRIRNWYNLFFFRAALVYCSETDSDPNVLSFSVRVLNQSSSRSIVCRMTW